MGSRIRGVLTLWRVPRLLRYATFALIGVAVGLGFVTARLGNVASYLSDSPQTCVNCHVMTDAYATWQRGSHGHVAVCVDCHVPHNNPVAKLAFKGTDGMKHSYVFTMRTEPQVLRLSERAVPVVQANCLRCHGDQFGLSRLPGPEERKCWDCHDNFHGSVRSLSASPQVLRPRLPDAGLDWMKKGTNP
jgi:cytochrome c nitrite reductase small subunit